MSRTLDLGSLGVAEGGQVLLRARLKPLRPGDTLTVRGSDPTLAIQVRALARAWGHGFRAEGGHLTLVRGTAVDARWVGAEPAGDDHAPSANAKATWGIATRGATVEAGLPPLRFSLDSRDEVWTEDAHRLYLQAAAAQWDPATAIEWDTPFLLDDAVEDAVVQVMTYLTENETAALLVPARFLTQVHPHFREITQLLAIQAADEARHIEVFTRRTRLRGRAPGTSTVGGQLSLRSLLEEPDFALATFLTSVLGEGSFLSLLRFLQEYGPDPVTRAICRLAAQDEARHVAFGLAHLERHVAHDPALRPRLAAAVEQRNDALRHTAGLNEEVFEALVVLAAGSWAPEDIRVGWRRVLALGEDMDHGRRVRLGRLGFSEAEAEQLSGLHTRNFM